MFKKIAVTALISAFAVTAFAKTSTDESKPVVHKHKQAKHHAHHSHKKAAKPQVAPAN